MLDFSNHLDMIRAGSYRLLAFSNRVTRELKVTTLLHLCRTIVLPILTYASAIWSPYEETDCQIGVQHRLLRMLAYNSGEPLHFLDHAYSPVDSKFNLPTLSSLRLVYDTCFDFKAIKNIINSPKMFSCLYQEAPNVAFEGVQ